ncbi:hypothetical protein FPV67DRAFT_1484681 [Lyophyllum atratum]|nr:hypothetical protein FPV67DRAFT_1484681 [Lyophyllum atratum]
MGGNNLQSPFMDRLKTNYLATDVEVPKIRQIVSNSLEELQRIDERISRSYALIDDLNLQWKKLDEHIHDHRALISGIRKLPVEVIQIIFCWCLPSRNCAMSSVEPPLSLGRVCSTWRQISFSTPQLWSSLHISPPLDYGHGRDQSDWLVPYGEAIEAWLTRSASLPISISFVEEQYPAYPSDAVSTENRYLLGIMFGFSRRWKHLNLRIIQEYMRPFTSLTENDVPVLETVQLELIKPSPGVDFALVPFLHFPSIRKLSLWNYIHRMPSSLPVQWEVVTSLLLRSRDPYNPPLLTISHALDLLNGCPRLAIFACDVSPDGVDIVSMHAISLPHLRELRLKLASWPIQDEEQIKSFFESLDLPQLRHIELMGASYFCQLPFIRFIPPLFPQSKIDTMAFDIETTSIDDLSECLRMTPFLKRLYLESPRNSCDGPWDSFPGSQLEEAPPEALPTLSAAFISGLTPEPSVTETTLCPLLEEVELLFPSSTNVTDDDILQFILSRTMLAPEGMVRLRRANFTFRRCMQRDIYPDLAPVLEMGFKLHLKYDEPLPASRVIPIFMPFNYISICDDLQYDAWQPRSSVVPPAWGPRFNR